MKIESDQCCEIFFLTTLLLLMKDQGSSHGDVSLLIFRKICREQYKFLMRNHLLLLREKTLLSTRYS